MLFRSNVAAADTSAVALVAYGIGLPGFVLVRCVIGSFYARQDTATPVRATVLSVIANILFKVVAVWGLHAGVVGIALGTSFGAWVNLLVLTFLARRRGVLVATTESWRDKATGERKDRTEWHNVTIFNEQLGKVAEQYVKKGSKIYLEGALQTREYTDKDGNQRKATDVVLQRYRGELTLLDSRGGGREGGESFGGGGERQSFGRSGGGDARPAPAGAGRTSAAIDDDIPF